MKTAGNWLSDMDSNHDKVLQRDLCYHYTIGQARRESISRLKTCKENFRPRGQGTFGTISLLPENDTRSPRPFSPQRGEGGRRPDEGWECPRLRLNATILLHQLTSPPLTLNPSPR